MRFSAGSPTIQARLVGIVAVILLASPVVAAGAASQPLQVGANLEGVTYYSRSLPFADMMKQARGFGPYENPYQTVPGVPVDQQGWPTTDFGIQFMVATKELKSVDGIYKLSFWGKADVSGSDFVKVQNYAHDAATNMSSADVVVSVGVPELSLKFRNTGSGCKAIKLIRPGHGPTDIYGKEFLEHFKRFNTLRFMDWLNTNGQKVGKWEERSLPTDVRYSTDKGVPWEAIIHLGNTLQKDIWINIPFAADDDYVEKLASLIAQRFDPKLHIYVEYSNELWNSDFQQSRDNVTAANEEALNNRNSTLNKDGNKDKYYLGSRRTARRIKEIAEIFVKVMGPKSLETGRVRPILAGQLANLDHLEKSLGYLKTAFRADPRKYLYGVAGALYINTKAYESRSSASVEDLLGALREDLEKRKEDLKEAADFSKEFRLPFLGYEGGLDTFGEGHVETKRALQFDPAVQQLVTDVLATWYSEGLGEVLWFSGGASMYAKHGAWGLTDDMGNQSTPKIKGVDAFLADPQAAIEAVSSKKARGGSAR